MQILWFGRASVFSAALISLVWQLGTIIIIIIVVIVVIIDVIVVVDDDNQLSSLVYQLYKFKTYPI